MRRALIGGELRLHDGVAGLPAKRDRFHIGNRAIGQLAGDHDVQESGDADEGQQTPEFEVLQVERREVCRIDPCLCSLLFRA